MKPLGPTDPQRVGHYRLLGKLGAGGMGSVYLARSDRGRTVAVKVVQPELARQPEFRQRFQHEVDAARRVGGEWTAPVLDGDTEAATPWVATGYVAGPSLHEVVASTYGRLPERTLRILANGLVRALRDIHAAGLVHRDLKPSNVMITIDGPRVIDFGIARALEATSEGLTRTGAAVGSPGFMSPEQCRGETLSAASDIFCLGSVLTFAATGRTPFGDANSAMTALMLRIVQNQQDLTEVPEAIRPLIEACLAGHPAERPSLDQLLDATATDEADDEPWLPGALIAKLGRHAVELLDSEDPLQAPPLPAGSPPPAMPSAPPTPAPPSAMPGPPPAAPPTPTQLSVPATPPPSPHPNGPVDAMATMTSAMPPAGYGPQGQGMPPQQGVPPQQGGAYGYPQQAHGVPGYGHPSDPNNPYGGGYGAGGYGPPGGPMGPGGPGGPGGGRNNRTLWIVVAAVAGLALIAGIAVFALAGGDDDNNKADPPAPTPTGETTPTDPPTTEDPPTEDPPTEDPPEFGTGEIPLEMVGAWEGEIVRNDGAVWFQRVEITEGMAGDLVTTQYTVLANSLCVEQSSLVEAAGTDVVLTSDYIDQQWPSDADCGPWGEQTLAYNGGSLTWTAAGYSAESELAPAQREPDRDSMPYPIHSKTWTAGGLTIDMETTSYPGELALTFTDGSCTWESVMVSGALYTDHIIIGPGEDQSNGCDPLPSYRVHWPEEEDDPEVITFSPMGDPDDSFDATLTD
ncbi:serine/threonine-protein kinase [Streptomyces profundus]|uniref:serine/threonine-protein kinase n=1 Tax=Streptomyces profundus TaxID=2867410 RepID=UPI001D167D4B|nr:serine/threonine-protein kinase [Streptomyces sp. MA3_2.13]UED84994.1 serine/threonine protein kinase [Streptomyces sp. MA3_2.13]